ncbi:MAG: pyruvate dehydrogenase (acetyl-transferring), homodimeric type [Gemmataceae bacterium]|nr:pyruvate dehydrogenase (acetyl-transferring), homodimeric type [Gemmataceae bacterium]MDW8264670.1 pyruvate dehydrogenase (acetyl-transferring), homodimeric type [Gemmataceae bacterium]
MSGERELNGRVDDDPEETREWLDAFEGVLRTGGPSRASYLLRQLKYKASRSGVAIPFSTNTPYVNTIPAERQPPYPGSREIERRIKSLVRWNAMAMVVRANKQTPGIGGHISTFASAATLYEVGFNHFFRGPEHPCGGDLIYFQGHAAPGIYARAFLEGRLSQTQLENFRRELAPGGGLASYPHPWLMPHFWQFPTVSMGLGAIMAIYQARFLRYLEHRGLKPATDQRVWCFLGDGETDEPETLGALTLAAREKLDNLIFVINCNLQRLDGPVRGNGKIIQELEAAFRGAGWNVIKVIWGSDWDPLLAQDRDGLLVQRMNEVVDGEFQKYTVEPGAYIREHFFGKYPELKAMVRHLSDEQLRKLSRGGHDPEKVYAAYKAAVEHTGSPTVILAKTIKGYGLGEAGEGRNVTHQQKKLNEEELREFRSRFGIPLSDDAVKDTPFYLPSADSREMQYLRERRAALGGPVPVRVPRCAPFTAPGLDQFAEFLAGSGDGEFSTTMVFVGLLKRLLNHKEFGRYIVPIIPDEARTFGMDALFKQYGIYSNVGQLYEPVDAKMLLAYREAKNGQILEEGITEAGAISSFIAAGTACANQGIPTIPFFIFYSMFGFQRIGDLIWAAADMRARGFLLGGTAGRTTLMGEGLQHQDGHSHVLASTVPTVQAYDPAYAYELAVILQDGLRRMYQNGEDIFYYITLYNETYPMPPMPEGAAEGIVRGLYKLKPTPIRPGGRLAAPPGKVHLFGSGPLLREALRAQDILAQRYGIAADVWSATSYKELRRDALETERWNLLHPTAEPRRSYLERLLAAEEGVFLAVSDYMRAVPEMIARWVPGGLFPLGTDGFGRSDDRPTLRRFFEVDAECITVAALWRLASRGLVPRSRVQEAIRDLGLDPDKLNPLGS